MKDLGQTDALRAPFQMMGKAAASRYMHVSTKKTIIFIKNTNPGHQGATTCHTGRARAAVELFASASVMDVT